MVPETSQSSAESVHVDSTGPRGTVLVLLAVVLVAAFLRWPGMFTAFWLDEIWSLELAKRLRSAAGVFTDLHHDNNHHLNTLWLYALGPRDGWVLYRIPSLIAGIGAVALAWRVARRRGRLEALFASVLFAGSYPLIQFSSEARGYSLAVFFALATWLAAQVFVEDRRWRRAIALWICVSLGCLAHLTFVHVVTATAVWMVWRIMRLDRNPVRAGLWLWCGLGPPALLLVALYLVDIRHIVIGGGQIEALGVTVVTALSLIVGGPTGGLSAVLAAIPATGLCIAGLVGERRTGRDGFPFLVTVIFLSPAALLFVVDPVLVYFRYFLVSLAFALLVCAYALADIFRRGRLGRAFAVTAIVACLAGNAVHVRRFYTYGRGGYLEGLTYIVDHSAEPRITVAGDYDFRHNALVTFYQPYLPSGKTIVYLPNGTYPPEGPEWVILHRIGGLGEVEATITPGKPPAPSYRLERVLPSSELSGWAWLLYRRIDPSPGEK